MFKFANDVTPHDANPNILDHKTTPEACTCRAIMVAVAGNVSFLDGDGKISIVKGLLPGTIYPISTSRINATSTTATGIVALW